MILLLLTSLLLQDPARPKDKTDEAIERGVKFLAGVSDKDGAIAQAPHNRTAMTALAILAMAATGNQPTDETPAGQAMKRGLAFVLKDQQDPQGFLGGKDGSRMYGHGITTLMLSEMLGMGVDAQMDQQLRERCKRAVELILRSQAMPKDQRSMGGWRYMPDSRDSDLSVTVWQLMALRSAKNAGLDVPKEAIDRAVGYVKRCFKGKKTADGKPDPAGKGACAYEPGQNPEYAMAAAGLLSLQICGDYESPEVAASADWLKERKLEWNSEWFFYGTYYYSQGMFQRGGDYALHGRKAVEEVVLPKQAADGSWQGQHGQESGAGRVYGTAMALLCLAVRNHYLPIYQR